jgi:signal peptidase II
VADFFHFYGFGYDWYVFNIADLAITLGAIAILYDVLKPSQEGETQKDRGHEV